MSRVLIVPAAGMGTRLGAALPKLLVPVGGIAMIDRVLALYEGAVDHAVIVTSPVAEAQVAAHLAARRSGMTTECAVQARPTGMLDAVLLAESPVARRAPSHVWVTWCDQVAVDARTVQRLAELTAPGSAAALVMPTVRSADPYIHLARDGSGRIVRVLHRREGDAMPAEGESDMGLFALSSAAYLQHLPDYAREVEPGAATGERNFLPFIAWMAARGEVVTFPAHHRMEAVGINTPAELTAIEEFLSQR
jgi:bifunctional UDP-N-acetylglucosamine pyrophosphorylase/glucosamine-1-phosphate N-acetyltransferase